MRAAALVLCGVLAGCAGHGEPLSEPCRTTEGPIKVVVHDSVGALRVWALEDPRVETVWNIEGQFLRLTDPQEIHVVQPRSRHDERTLKNWGHELMHFACGHWDS